MTRNRRKSKFFSFLPHQTFELVQIALPAVFDEETFPLKLKMYMTQKPVDERRRKESIESKSKRPPGHTRFLLIFCLGQHSLFSQS